MAHDDPRYRTVNELHDLGYPAITRVEASRARQLLFRAFGKLEDAAASRTAPMWKSLAVNNDTRRCWVSLRPTTGMNRGWGRLIHDVAHRVYKFRHPHRLVKVTDEGAAITKRTRDHGAGENVIETEIAYYVRYQTNWLTGTLSDKPKQKPHRLPILEQRLARWESKLRRAETAIKKLKKQIKYHQAKILKEGASGG